MAQIAWLLLNTCASARLCVARPLSSAAAALSSAAAVPATDGAHGIHSLWLRYIKCLTASLLPIQQPSAWRCPTHRWAGWSASLRCRPASTDGWPPLFWVSYSCASHLAGHGDVLVMQAHAGRLWCVLRLLQLPQAHSEQECTTLFRRLRPDSAAGQNAVHPPVQGMAVVWLTRGSSHRSSGMQPRKESSER